MVHMMSLLASDGRRGARMAAPNNRLFLSLMSKTHTFWYRLSGGALGAQVSGMPVLLLTTTGRKSGQPRTTPLMYLEDGDNVIVIASNSGDDRDPGWWRNLKSHPEATIQLKRERRTVRAERATPEQKARVWPTLIARNADYDEYAKRTTRDIPVVILKRVTVRMTEPA
jgi:deazaflavin-dependent oxidoreductase (nitroreductase family)